MAKKIRSDRLKELIKNFGTNLYKLRCERGESVKEFAENIGFLSTQVHALERGSLAVRLDTVYKIADALKVDPGRLLSDLSKDQLKDRVTHLRDSRWQYVDKKAREANMTWEEWLDSLVAAVKGDSNIDSFRFKEVATTKSCSNCDTVEQKLHDYKLLFKNIQDHMEALVNFRNTHVKQTLLIMEELSKAFKKV